MELVNDNQEPPEVDTGLWTLYQKQTKYYPGP